ncbi:flagellar FlbD family protein [Enterococcus lemanii]|uniref:Flagellar FlbD family protein n=1 Tax=Enterococcus lemanii TaxID=1159752 RepID=A0ABV9MV39_9ENTE|nr:flagellar FlbD family protein [Enterococcus lemanii]MBM7708064.1 flagellar protein FlbD [Enterococcus lemanii]
MIEVTALNGKNFYLNPDLIYRMDELPDTTITLVDGKVLIVRDSSKTVAEKIITYRKEIYQVMVDAVIRQTKEES